MANEMLDNILVQIHIDDLTGLKNYKCLFHEHGEASLEHYHFIYVDIDDYNKMNMVFGVDTVDAMLIQVAKTLSEYCGKSDVYRVGNDQFLIVTNSQILCEASALMTMLKQPFKHNDLELTIDASIIVADHDLFEDDTLEDTLKLLKMTADLSKNEGHNRLIYTNDSHKERYNTIKEVETNLHSAMDRNEIFPKYRPFVDTFSYEIIGFEAVSRWNLNGRELKPNSFLEVAQWTGIIYDIEMYIFKEALKFYQELKDGNKKKKKKDKYYSNFKAGINLSAYTLKRMEIETIIEMLLEYNMSAKDIIIEIDEASITSRRVYHKIKNLYELGFIIILDNYSNQNSSLSYLADLKVDILKLSESLLQKVNNSEEYNQMKAVYSFFVDFGKRFDLSIISTGVKTKEDLELLRELDIHIATGDYFTRAIVKDDFIDYLENSKVRKVRF